MDGLRCEGGAIVTHETKHTPGPWHVRNNRRLLNAFVVETRMQGVTKDGKGIGIAWCDGNLTAQNEANAHLIAAAPEMYEALAALIEHAEWMGTPQGYSWSEVKEPVDRAKAALAKARGE